MSAQSCTAADADEDARYDNIALSDDDEKKSDDDDDGEELGASDTDTADASDGDAELDDAEIGGGDGGGGSATRADSDDCDDDDDDEDGDDADSGGRSAKRRKKEAPPVPKRRPVNGNEIELCFFPLGSVPGAPLTLLGATLVNVMSLDERTYAEAVARLHGQEVPVDEVQQRFLEVYDFFEKQTARDAPLPRHFCQLTHTENMCNCAAAHGTPVAPETLRRALLECEAQSGKPRRAAVYCLATFATDEEVREHMSPLLCFPLKGELLRSATKTSNWQSATEWPHMPLDRVNATANAARVTESLLARSTLKLPPKPSCTARQPLSVNAVFEVRVTGRSQFPDIEHSLPIRYTFSFAQSDRAARHADFLASEQSLTARRVASVLSRTNYTVESRTDRRAAAQPCYYRKQGLLPSVCEAVCQKIPQAAAVLTRQMASKQNRQFVKRIMRYSKEPGKMLFEDALSVVKDGYVDDAVIRARLGDRTSFVAGTLLAALAPNAFWELVSVVGFDATVYLFVTKQNEEFYTEAFRSPAPYSLLESARFRTLALSDNARFREFLRSRHSVSPAAFEQLAALSAALCTAFDTDRSERRCISRPDVDASLVLPLCWPANERATLAAFQFAFPAVADGGGGQATATPTTTTTFVSRTQRMRTETLVAAALVHGFERRVTLLRSDDAQRLVAMVGDLMTDDASVHHLIVVNRREDYDCWQPSSTAAAAATNDGGRICVVSLGTMVRRADDRATVQYTPPRAAPDGAKWRVVVPRVDTFTYDELAALLTLLCVGVDGASDAEHCQSAWCRAMFGARDSPDWQRTAADFRRGTCGGGERLVVGALAFQSAEPDSAGGAFADDLYFSGVLDADAQIVESYAAIDALRLEALNDNGGGGGGAEGIGRNGALDTDAAIEWLSKRHTVFSRTADGAPLFGSANNFALAVNRRNGPARVLVLWGESTVGTVGDAARSRIDASERARLPVCRSAESRLQPNRFNAVVFDTVADNDYFKPNVAAGNRLSSSSSMSYEFGKMPQQYTRAIVDLIVADHRVAKNDAGSGLSLRSTIALLARRPAHIAVFGSCQQSLEQRITAQQHAPWFLQPPTHNLAGRQWQENSEAVELSSLCWLLARFWRRQQ